MRTQHPGSHSGKYSIILPTYLGWYEGAAERREEKLPRAIKSVLEQSFNDWELIVVCDGCQESFDIASAFKDSRVSVHLIEKQPTFSGMTRNYGIAQAKGDYILYIDNDDFWGHGHIEGIDKHINGFDWVFFDDIILMDNEWYPRICDERKLGRSGTSNICHKRAIAPAWGGGYAHDFYFIKQLRRSRNYKKIDAGEYYVCHIPNIYDI